MSMLEFRQRGLNDFIKKATSINKGNIDKAIIATIDDARQAAYEYAVGYAPKDTGKLAESVYANPVEGGMAFMLGATADYAVFNEYGSITTPIGDVSSPRAAKKTGVRPFLRPALLHVRQEFPKVFGGKFQNITGLRVASETY